MVDLVENNLDKINLDEDFEISCSSDYIIQQTNNQTSNIKNSNSINIPPIQNKVPTPNQKSQSVQQLTKAFNKRSNLTKNSKLVFREIDKIEDENAYNINILLKTIESEQKNSEQENLLLNEKIKNLHDTVKTRHSIITQLQGKLKHAEATNRLNQTKFKSEIDQLNLKIQTDSTDYNNQIDHYKKRVDKLMIDLDNKNIEFTDSLKNRDDEDKKLRDKIQNLIAVIGNKDDKLSEMHSQNASLQSGLKAFKARHDRQILDLNERITQIQKSHEDSLINIKAKHLLDLDQEKQTITSRDDHISHLKSKLEKSDERLLDKINLIKSEYSNKVNETQMLNKEQDREIFRLKSQLDEKLSKNCELKSKNEILIADVARFRENVEKLKFEMKDLVNDNLIKENEQKAKFENEKKLLTQKIDNINANIQKSRLEMSKLTNFKASFNDNLNNNFKKILEQQEKCNLTSIQYHDCVKDNFNAFIKSSRDALGHIEGI